MRKVAYGLVMALVLVGPIGFAGLRFADAQDKKDKDKDKATAGAIFEVYKDRGGEFRFRLKDGDGTLLAISGKGYDKKADVVAVIDAIKKEAAKAKVMEEDKK
jgi:uncharacterized protein YegP (UPF0339 family)